MAVLFITKIENNETKNEGLCLKCAKELGIPQVDSILSGMGISEDDFEAMENDLQSLMGGVEGDDSFDEEDDEEDPSGESRTPSLDFSKLFNQFPFANGFMSGNKKPKNSDSTKDSKEDKGEEISGRTNRGLDQKKEEKSKKKEDKRKKYLGMYCRDLTAAAKEGKLDAVIGRERETARLMQILSRRQSYLRTLG